ncbi:hypothetical protein ACIOD2_24390 [Amycolatopsis sp. NPDC088138]|uniref:hypothetical protein n=1 Tax=Amycolatopsis sp. NPDC088138 TaxID=3363938 RepID=UPI0038208E98
MASWRAASWSRRIGGNVGRVLVTEDEGATQAETVDEGRVTLEELRFRRPLP